MAAGPSPDAVAAMHDARVGLRNLWVSLGSFEAMLANAAREQAMLAGGSAQAAEAQASEDSQAPDNRDEVTGRLAHTLASAARQQAVTADLVDRLERRRAARIKPYPDRLGP